MRIHMAALAMVACAGSASAGVLYTGGLYTENFDGLPSTSPSPSPFSSTIGQQFSLNAHGVAEWQVAKIAGTGTTAMPFIATDGSSATGGIHSLGAAGSGERALGLLASGTNIAAIGVEIINGLSFTVTDVSFTFNREVWRSSTSTQNIMLFAWGVSGGSITSSNFLSDASMTPDPQGDLVGLAPVATNGPIPVNSLGVTVNLTGLSLAPGQSLFLRWSDFNDIGNDAAIGIDDFNFAMTPTPGSLALLGLGGLSLLRRRR